MNWGTVIYCFFTIVKRAAFYKTAEGNVHTCTIGILVEAEQGTEDLIKLPLGALCCKQYQFSFIYLVCIIYNINTSCHGN